MREQAKRLYAAARILKKVVGQSAVARLLNVSPQVVKNWESRGVSKEGMIEAQKIIGCSSVWLDTGDGEMVYSNVEAGPDVKGHGRYPVISAVQAGHWTELCDIFQPGDAEEWSSTHHNLGNCGYVLRVKGPSMTAPTGSKYSFPEGMLLYVNPDMEPAPGQFVIVRREREKEAVFKRYVVLDGEPYLEAINPDWPTHYLKMQEGDVFCGVVVDASFGNLP